jgi:hypothetical protein
MATPDCDPDADSAFLAAMSGQQFFKLRLCRRCLTAVHVNEHVNINVGFSISASKYFPATG